MSRQGEGLFFWFMAFCLATLTGILIWMTLHGYPWYRP